MMDNLTAAQRSKTMSRVRGKNTGPEMVVRRLIYRMGYRYRLHRADLPGKPDLVFRSLGKVIFVNGCFWHGHDCSSGKKQPKTNEGYWLPKLARNKERDKKNRTNLNELGWDILVLWECQLKDNNKLKKTIVSFLGGYP